MTRILLVEDEESFSDPLSYLLRKEDSGSENDSSSSTSRMSVIGIPLVCEGQSSGSPRTQPVCRASRHRSSGSWGPRAGAW